MTRRSEAKDVILAEIEKYPVDHIFGIGGKHPFVTIIADDGRTRRVTYPGTPSDSHRGRRNMVAGIRRALRALCTGQQKAGQS